ncbi:MAG: tRNA (cytidine(34)-2'-O)-methyltransferase [Chitinophagales bacterium]|nr:tRNA (cytidine(34)-2'-O)-methyltransferase [Chitinophagales bacterium]MDC3209333.1 tRNA (cytidine(34)-2'-O)-methyltransferase [Chitinophagales bacterium]
MALNIVLIEPEIPNNTGNIGRLCLAVGAKLHLVKPYGFELSDSRLKRAGLDYWKHIEVQEYGNMESFFRINQTKPMVYFSSHGKKDFWDIPFEADMFLVFGKESKGLGADVLEKNLENTYKIPLHSKEIRSLNLANAVGIVAYEGMRQLRGH